MTKAGEKVVDVSFEAAVAQLGRDAAWYLVCCLNGMATAMETLSRAGIPVYCPHITVMRPPPLRELAPAQRKFAYMMARPVNVPLFPGYFLVGLGGATRVNPFDIFALCHVDGLRCEDGVPVEINDDFVRKMRAAECKGALPAATPLKLLLEPGDLVRVLDGPFAGFTGTVDDIGELALGKLDESVRLWIALTLFGRQTRSEQTLGNVVRVERV